MSQALYENSSAKFASQFSEDEVLASICRDSYFDFFVEFWEHMSGEELQLNWHIEFLCEEIQKVCERVFEGKAKLYDLIINVPPGTSKSSIVSRALLPWIWTKFPKCQMISGYYTSKLAMPMALNSRDMIESEKYQRMFGPLRLRTDEKSKSRYMNQHGGWRISTSVGASIIGQHAHIITVDDPIEPLPEKASSTLMFEKANDWIHQTLSMRCVDKEVTPTIMVMQRLHQLDPTGYWLEYKKKRTVKHICLPAELADNVSPPRVRSRYVKGGGLLDPIRLSKNNIEKQKETLGNFGSAAQLAQSPIAAGGNMFDVSKLLQNTKKFHPPMVRTVRYWDNAATDGSGDYSVGLKMGIDADGRIWILDVIRGQFGSAERENMKLAAAISDGEETRIGQELEGGSSGKDSVRETIKRLHGFKVQVFKPMVDKVTRADTFSYQVNNLDGNVYLVKANWNAAYIDELRYFPHGAHDDQVDASSGAYTMLIRRPRKVVGH